MGILAIPSLSPDNGHVLAEVILDGAVVVAMAGGQEFADDAADVAADIEFLRGIDTLTLHTEPKASYAIEDYRLTFCQMVLHRVLQLSDYMYYVRLLQGTVSLHLFHQVCHRHLSPGYGLSIVLAIVWAALYVVLQQLYPYCHVFSLKILRGSVICHSCVVIVCISACSTSDTLF